MSRHAYIRVHVHPKRFPAAYIVDWKVLCDVIPHWDTFGHLNSSLLPLGNVHWTLRAPVPTD